MNDDSFENARSADRPPRKRTAAVAAAVGVAGLVAGGLAAGAISAGAISAASAESGGGAQGGYGRGTGYDGGPFDGRHADPSRPMRGDEELLTGETRRKVLAAVEGKYPDATVQRVETDSDGVYEAHILNDDEPLVVQVGEDFTITGTQTGGPGRGEHGGPGMPGDSPASAKPDRVVG